MLGFKKAAKELLVEAVLKFYRWFERENIKNFLVLQGIRPDKQAGKKKHKNIFTMNSDEFYEFLKSKDTINDPEEELFNFMLDWLLISYVEGKISFKQLSELMLGNNPYNFNRYIDRALRNSKLAGDDILDYYHKDGEDSNELYSLILPKEFYDKEKKELKIKTMAELKKAVNAGMFGLEKQKKELAMAKMQQAEKERQEKYLKASLANSPEIAEMLSSDHFVSEQQELNSHAHLLYDKIESTKKNKIVREAGIPRQLQNVINRLETDMSPSELIASKRALLQKMKNDLKKGQGGLDIRR